MAPLSTLLVNFLGLGAVASLFHADRLDLSTLTGAQAVLGAVFPVLLLVEVGFLVYRHRKARGTLSRALKLPLLIYAVHAVISAYLFVDVLVWTQRAVAPFALFHAGMNVGWFVFAYLALELSHYVSHWLTHKVRILWCLHSPHHAVEHMNLSVVHANFLYQATWSTFVRVAICTFLGVPLPMLLFVLAIDGCWGSLIHVSEEAWRSGRLRGPLGRLFLSPVHHRVHHASNPEYIDKNFCNTLPVWDHLFGTFQDDIPGVPPKYGITRPVIPGNFADLYFGEIGCLLRDIAGARSVREAILYAVMPPGWKPTPQVAMNT
jgi:sterol desaturase/sphingolipid hydroxylase (fatty acid hydroxylase superfamily)